MPLATPTTSEMCAGPLSSPTCWNSAIERTMPVSKHSHSGTTPSSVIAARTFSILSTGLSKSSGGQAQRLAIARAFLKNAPIVVLDEPTSQIDVETETLLNRALARLTANKIVLLIAHRLSTIEQADRIIVLEGGRLAESGTRQELLARGGIYAGMIRTKREIEAQSFKPALAGG